MKVTRTRFLPVLVSATDPQIAPDQVIDEFVGPIGIAYSYGPPYGQRLVTWSDLDRLDMPRRVLRRTAMENLDRALVRLQVDGQPPAPMLSFSGLERGLESSALLADEVWLDLAKAVPGDPVVGVPARDVVILTGTGSRPGLERTRRAVDRVFFAGSDHLLSRDLLVWREGTWLPFKPPGPPDLAPYGPAGESPFDPAPEPSSYGPPPYEPAPYDPPPSRRYRPPAPRSGGSLSGSPWSDGSRSAPDRDRRSEPPWLDPPERPAGPRPGPRRRRSSDPPR